MVKVVSVADIFDDKIMVDTEITVQGWVRSRRDSKAGFSFVALYDGSSFDTLQIVINNDINNYTDEVLKLTAGCSLEVAGTVVYSQGSGQKFEIQARSVKVVGWVDNPETYPASAKHHTLEHLREYAHLRPRTNVIGAVARVRNCLSQAINRFFYDEGFYWIHTPIITASDCEGAGEMFRVSTLDMENLPRENGKVDYSKDFFGKESFLTVSGQLNVETYCCAISKVYTFGPTFRAENSNTSRHLAEFWMVEPEIAFADLNDDAALAEKMLKYLAKAVLEERADDMGFFEKRINGEVIKRLQALIDKEFVQIDYSDAVNILQESGQDFQYKVEWGVDLQSEHERFLSEQHFKAPAIIKNYPKEIKAFYMRLNDDEKTVAAMDVIAPGIGEIIGGSQREERLDVFDRRLAELNLNPQDYYWYRDLRRYGTVPHAGFGLGLERLIAYVTGMANVRDVIPFPRTPGHADF